MRMIIEIELETAIGKLCSICQSERGSCSESKSEICCLKQLQFMNYKATGKDIFEYCCILTCGFNKHRCDTCLIGESSIINFIKQEKRIYPSIFDFEEIGVEV